MWTHRGGDRTCEITLRRWFANAVRRRRLCSRLTRACKQRIIGDRRDHGRRDFGHLRNLRLLRVDAAELLAQPSRDGDDLRVGPAPVLISQTNHHAPILRDRALRRIPRSCSTQRAQPMHRGFRRQWHRVQPSRRERAALVPRTFIREIAAPALARAHEQRFETRTLARDPFVELLRRREIDAAEEGSFVERECARERLRILALDAEHELGGVDREHRVRGERDLGLARRDRGGAEHAAEMRERVAERVARASLVLIRPKEGEQRVARERSARAREHHEEHELEPSRGERWVFAPTLREEREPAQRDESKAFQDRGPCRMPACDRGAGDRAEIARQCVSKKMPKGRSAH